jgi:acetyltransferase-like isoleucine patch superfamily enzyme
MIKRIIVNFVCLFLPGNKRRESFRRSWLTPPCAVPPGAEVFIVKFDKNRREVSRKQVDSYPGLTIVCRGSANNVVEIEESSTAMTLKLIFSEGDGHFFSIGAPSLISENTIHIFAMLRRSGARLTIGRGLQGAKLIAVLVGGSISIGEDCLFSMGPVGIEVRNSDLHSLLDRATGEVLNKTRDVVIGNHVWLAEHVTIMKGACVPDDCVVGAFAVVTGALKSEPHSLIAGIPANPIRKNITWHGDMPENYQGPVAM